MARSRRSNFQAGQGVFTCPECGKRTRGTGDSNVDMCSFCEQASEWMNSIMDGQAKLSDIPKKYQAWIKDRIPSNYLEASDE